MWEKFIRNWNQGKRLAAMPWYVIKYNKKLILFPLISSILINVFTIIYFAILLDGGDFDTFYDSLIKQIDIMSSISEASDLTLLTGGKNFTQKDVFLFAFYSFITAFTAAFFYAALIASSVLVMVGERVSFFESLKMAFSKIFKIFFWTLILSIFGLILNIIEKRSELIGKIVVILVDTTFSIASFLVMPVMIFEDKNPVSALGTSSKLLKNTWGKQIMGRAGFGIIFFILHILGVCFAYFAFVLLPKFCILYILILVIYFIFLAAIQTALSAIFKGALYIYATTGEVPEGFDAEIMSETFTVFSK